MKKILVSDYDRTFYLNKEGIKKNIEAVERFRKNGNLFVIATGRSFLDFKKKQYKYHFDYDYVILNHGATLLDRKGHILDNNVINNEVVLDIKKDVQDIKTKKQFCCSAKESRVDFLFGNITKIYLEYESQNITTMVNEMINNKYGEYVNSYDAGWNIVETISSKCDKKTAILKIANKEGISKNEIYTIGDGNSDFSIIKKFNGFCMENSILKLKEYCKDRTKRSVSDFIEDILNEKIK